MQLDMELIHELKFLLNDLILKIQNINEFDEEEHYSVYSRYREVSWIYQSLTSEEIEVFFEPHEAKLIEYFQLGAKHEADFDKLALSIKEGLSSVYDFISKGDGFSLLNSQENFDIYTEEELTKIFGSLFGINLSQKCVRSLKAERIGSVIGYALSGCFENIRDSLTGLSDEDVAIAIKTDIAKQDKCLVYQYDEKDNGIVVDAHIVSDNPNRTRVRGRNRADHCFINHKTRTITIGSVTSNIDATSQGYSFYKSYLAASEMVKAKFLSENLHKNPYYGYTVQPFVMLNSRFSVEKNDVEVGSHFKEMLSRCSPSELKDVSQVTWLRMMSNCMNRDQLIALAEHQTFIVGCDTSNLDAFTHKTRHTVKQDEKFQTIFDFTMKSAIKAVKALNKNDIDLDFGKKVRTLQTLSDIHDSVQNILRRSKYELSQRTFNKYVEPLANELSTLAKRLDAGSHHNQSKQAILEQLNELSYQLSDFDRCSSYIQRAKVYPVENIAFVGNFWMNDLIVPTSEKTTKAQTTSEKVNSNTKIDQYAFMKKISKELSKTFSSVVVSNFKTVFENLMLDKKNAKKDFYCFFSSRIAYMKSLGYTDHPMNDFLQSLRQLSSPKMDRDQQMALISDMLEKIDEPINTPSLS